MSPFDGLRAQLEALRRGEAPSPPVGDLVGFRFVSLRPVWTGKLRACGRVVGRGRTVGLAECEIADDQGRIVAHATSTCMALRGDMAAGR